MKKTHLRELYKNALMDGLALLENLLKEDVWARPLKFYKGYPIMRFNDSGLPLFYLNDHKKLDYRETLFEHSKKIESWKKYHECVISNDKFQRFYSIGNYKDENELDPDFFTYFQLSRFVNRYIHLNQSQIIYKESLFNKLFDKWYRAVNNKHLEVEVHIPILLLGFDFEEEVLNNKISIKKLDESIQLSRYGKTSNTDSSKSIVAGAATHSLVLKGWKIENKDYKTRLKNFNSIDIDSSIEKIIEAFFASLRICTGISSGYCQIITRAVNWEEGVYIADLECISVTTIRKYPDYFDQHEWEKKPPLINRDKTLEIFDCFKKVMINRFNRIDLALSKLNIAYLRSREEDTIVDVTTALEALLTHDSQTEITYRLASRIATLSIKNHFRDFNPYQVFGLCKKIYKYRSAVVHGNSKKTSGLRVVKLKENEKLPTVLISIELLRHILGILLDNPEYNDTDEIEKLKFKDHPRDSFFENEYSCRIPYKNINN